MVSQALLSALLTAPYIFPTIAYGATIKARAPDNHYVMNIHAFSWHESCADKNPANDQETKQDAVVRAWGGALELAADSKDRFGKTRAMLTKETPPAGMTKILVNRDDPA